MKLLPDRRQWLFAISAATLAIVAGVLLISSLFIRFTGVTGGLVDRSLFCYLSGGGKPSSFLTFPDNRNEIQALATIHYATTAVVPQQNINEIRITFDVLRSKNPCNFLVFGLGHDSLMWQSLNPNGFTLFLEEDPEWLQKITSKSSFSSLNAEIVKYRTRLDEADELIKSYKNENLCSPHNAYLKGNVKCKLALENLPQEVYKREWDLIMIDAPKGYYASAPGRMAAIFSSAVMARQRKGEGPTHVFLHDVNRKVERMYALEFLCEKYKVGGVDRLWHFVIPPAGNRTAAGNADGSFCS